MEYIPYIGNERQLDALFSIIAALSALYLVFPGERDLGQRLITTAVGIATTLAIVAASGLHMTPYNNYMVLANAILHGHVWIDWPGPRVDALLYHGKYYIIEAPLPALLVLPIVAAFGLGFNQQDIAALLAGVATATAWEICNRLALSLPWRTFLTAFFLLGTDLFWCATFGDVWFLAHVASATFTLLALAECAGARRGWLIALFAGCAFESRFSMALALPAYAALLWFGSTRDERRRALGGFALGIAPFVVLWFAYNELRWGLPYDIGYTEWYHRDVVGKPAGSPFRLQYVPDQLYSFFLRAPRLFDRYPYVVPTFFGVSLPLTSPALVYALFARRPPLPVLALWGAVILTAVPNFTYYVNGFAQFGMRHALDFEPFLFVLMAYAVKDGLNRFFSAVLALLCTYSVLVGIWGVWFWRTYYRPGIVGWP